MSFYLWESLGYETLPEDTPGRLCVDAAKHGHFGVGYRKEGGPLDTVTLGSVGKGTAYGGQSGYAHLYLRVRSYPSSEQAVLALNTTVNSPAGALTLDNLGVLRLYSLDGGSWGGGMDATAATHSGSSPTLSLNIWYHLEIYFNGAANNPGGPSAIPPSRPCELRLWVHGDDGSDQTLQLTATGQYGGTPLQFGLQKGFGNGDPITYLLSVAPMPTIAGLAAPATQGQYDIDSLSTTSLTGNEVLTGWQGFADVYWAYFPPPATQGFAYLPTTLPFTSASGWTTDAGGTLDARFLAETDPNNTLGTCATSAVAGAVLSVVVNANAVQYKGYRVSVYIRTAIPAASGTISLITDKGTITRTFSFAFAGWVHNWYPTLGASAEWETACVSEIQIAHPASASTARIQAVIVQGFDYAYSPPTPATNIVTVASGTYTGNGTVQAIVAALGGYLPGWIFLAPVNNGTGILWHDKAIGPVDWVTQAIRNSELLPSTTGFAVVDAAAQSNQSTITYRWYIISDESMRLLYRGALACRSGVVATIGTTFAATPQNLPASPFATAALWALQESGSIGSSATAGYYKGPGHTGVNSSPLAAGAEITTGIRALPTTSWEVGTLLAQSAPQISFMAWSLQFIAVKLWAITSYTGDGTASRVITLDLDGQSPGLVFGIPHSSAAKFVRHQNSGAGISQNMDSAGTSTTAITAFGANSLTVGLALNAVGVVYDVLALIDPPGGAISDDPTGHIGFAVDMSPGSDSGGGNGCLVSLPPGSDSGGGSGCAVTL